MFFWSILRPLWIILAKKAIRISRKPKIIGVCDSSTELVAYQKILPTENRKTVFCQINLAHQWVDYRAKQRQDFHNKHYTALFIGLNKKPWPSNTYILIVRIPQTMNNFLNKNDGTSRKLYFLSNFTVLWRHAHTF